MLRTTKITTALALTAASVALLAGCSTNAVTDAGATAKSVPAAVTPTPSADAVDPVFGKTVSYDGLDITVSKGTSFKPSQYAAGGKLPNNVKFKFTATNTGTEKYDPTLFSTTMTSGGQNADGVFDSEANLGSAPQTSLLPGKTVTWEEGYNVADPKDIQMDVSPGFEYETGTWTY